MLLRRLSGCDIVSYLFSYAGDQQASMDQPAASIAGRGEEEQQIALVPPTEQKMTHHKRILQGQVVMLVFSLVSAERGFGQCKLLLESYILMEGKIMNLYSMVIEHVTKLLISEFVI